jgi:S-adenosylmethionine synthetase
MDLLVTALPGAPLAEQPVEVVERKGLGHPDTICDALAEEVSVALCRFYLERFGTIFHHNVDKVLLVGGQSAPAFGAGEVLTPIEIHLAGRATSEVRGVRVPVEELAVESCRAWLREHLRYLDSDRHVRLHCWIRPGSSELVELFLRQEQTGAWFANDTSCGVGFAPLTPLESRVLEVEHGLRAPEALARHPERGEDLKVMAVRSGGRVALTVSDALVAAHVASLEDYQRKREALREDARRLAGTGLVEVNAGDDLERGAIYLTVTGTSAEAGDDGEAGRGNRVSGLIAPYRPMTMESVAGKNPVSHVGKIYNVAAMRIAQRIVRELAAVRGAECFLVSRVGARVSDPQLAHVRCALEPAAGIADVDPGVRSVLDAELASLGRICEEFVTRRAPIA